MMTDTRGRLTLGLVVAIGILATVSVSAQNNRWAVPYQQGLKAIQSGDYALAAQLLERAIAVESRAQANKQIEGVFRIDYFPYYYLGIAYLELHEYGKAQQNFVVARPTLTRQLLPKLDEYQQRLAAETGRGRPGGGREFAAREGGGGPGREGPPGREGGGRDAGPVRPEPPRSPNPAFEPAVRAADTALAGKRFADAISSFDAARAADLGEFIRQNLQPKREEAARGLQGQQLAEEARQLLQRSQLNASKAKFQQADQALPGQAAVAEGLSEIRQRQDTYQRLKTAAEQDVRSSNFQGALDKYGQARTADPDQSAADNLEARIKSVGERMKAATPAAVVDKSPGKGPDQDAARTALRDALNALFQGDAQRSIAILEPAAGSRADQSAASLHGYLGVAYATRALSLPPDDEPARTLREKALAEFRLAVRTQRDFQLSPRVVSPKILALFEQARSN